MIKIAPSIGSNGIGILPERTHIDHIVPLCQLIGIPVLVMDREVKECIELYYPPMEIIEYSPDDYCLDEPLAGYDFFVYTEPSRKATGHFQFKRYYTTERKRSIFTHHGNSEKCFGFYWFERLIDEDILLVYGDHMLEHFQKIGFTKPMVKCGNYRLAYVEQHREFFQERVKPHLFENMERKTVLYAPTWGALDRRIEWRFEYSTTLEMHRWILETIPQGYQVLVKLHPNHFIRMPAEIEALISAYRDHPHIRFIHELPLIYPLLEHIDLYVGDFSSVGYDFLYFNRPMFFLSDEREREIHQCGVVVREDCFWKKVEEDQSHLSPIRKKSYNHAFGEGICTSIS
ncbi:MAG: hypothetical protein S4CHLAM45_06440 [Chlamydiales bacterium]|nr:hypothetical protein [Chlamydiales bacterium]MCH9619816.1 hypothetical protein [Chlamydiales bacterium]MCH9622757.1 hypothetical protein [Chlamydiales bacterium]